MPSLRSLSFIAPFAFAAIATAGATPFSASGNQATVLATVDAFRAQLGQLNANVPGSLGSGRREINWDGVPDALSSPSAFPGDFFNFTAAGRARGIAFSTTADHLEVSAKVGNPAGAAVEFGNIDPSYPAVFGVFSPQRLFSPVGGTDVEALFFVPGTVTVPAAVRGFGVVFTDVDIDGTALIRAYNAADVLLAEVVAPAALGSENFSFAGVTTTGLDRIARVEIVSGNHALLAGHFDDAGGGFDVVAMDDFVYGEPISLDCPADLNGDNKVDSADLGLLLSAWGTVGANPTDFDGNGVVDGADLGTILYNWGPCS
jgi:hypothetical protein